MVKYNAFSQISSTKCWQLSSTSLDWLDALTMCVQQGGTLATVDNQQEQVFGFKFSVFNNQLEPMRIPQVLLSSPQPPPTQSGANLAP